MAGGIDLFPGFRDETVEIDGLRLHLRIGGSGPPVLLLHGYPQTHVMWHRLAGPLARGHTLVIPDLPGYGDSDAPAGGPPHEAYSKRRIAAAMVRLMGRLGFPRFAVVGHDRGGRVGYRLAIDHARHVARLAVLDILPTLDYWLRFDRVFGLRIYHWTFLAQPAPLPERMIGADPVAYLDHTVASWTRDKTLSAFDPAALDAYRAAFARPAAIHGACEDYRAGATVDVEHDREARDHGRLITCPVLALWGTAGLPADGEAPLEVWRRWALDVSGHGVDSGHFLAEENPEATLAALSPFLAAYALEERFA